MSAAQGKPLVPQPAIQGPQLVPPREAVPVRAESIERLDPHPFATALIIAAIALIGAFTFAGSVATWLLVRDTGVGWMFQ
jgi:hypothetical protein